MTPVERRAVSGLGAIFGLRLLGLFLILPVFALYADRLEGHTPFLVGLALGIYGLTQALLQLPYGALSDRVGRKPVIAFGLLVFACGSVIAAMSDSMAGVIVGRALQGAGAIAAAVIAFLADLTREENRTKAMAIVGITVGASFILSLLLGPILYTVIGVPGIFWLTAALALVGLVVLGLWVPAPVPGAAASGPRRADARLSALVRDPQLLRFDLGIFFLHCVLTAIFVVVPPTLVRHAGLAAAHHWEVYLPVMLLSVLGMAPLLFVAERRHRLRAVFAGAVALLVISQVVLLEWHTTLLGIAAGLLVFFIGFNVLEAMLPSLLSRAAPAPAKGTAIGIYGTFEFLGAFVGGAAGGWLHGRYGVSGVFIFTAVLLLVWFALALTMTTPPRLSTHLLRIGRRTPADARALADQLAAIPGVAEATVVGDEGVAYLRVDERRFDARTLERFAL